MSSRTEGDDRTRQSDAVETTDGRYAAIETETGVLIYDRQNPDAWIESRSATDFGSLA